MKLYIVNADNTGAYVDSGYKSSVWQAEQVNWIAVFHTKAMAQAYASYLNQNFTVEQLKTFVAE